jgi:hypothetical protein
MKDYDLKGLSIGGRKAVMAVCLPDAKGKDYKIHKIYNVSDTEGNKIVIHFKDKDGLPLEHGDNFELFMIDLTSKDFDGIDFKKEIGVAFHHENSDTLRRTPKVIYDDVQNRPNSIKTIKKSLLIPDSTGKGIIRI